MIVCRGQDGGGPGTGHSDEEEASIDTAFSAQLHKTGKQFCIRFQNTFFPGPGSSRYEVIASYQHCHGAGLPCGERGRNGFGADLQDDDADRPGVATPDRLDTSIGPLNLIDGFPKPDTIEKIYDNLDRSRALQAYLLAIPIVNQAGMRESLRKFGPVNTTNVIWETLVDPRTVELTANDNTIYSFIWLDTKKGPLVVEIPPKVLGAIDDFWYRWVTDVGITGPDKGAGGKYLILPPGYKGEIPKGYFVVRPKTYGNWMPFRSFLVDGSPKPGVESVKKNLKIYQLSDAANPPAIKFANASGVPANFVAPGDYSFWALLNQVIQEEPSTGSDPTTLGLFASIGIVKGKPFNPDERMKKILTDAANIGAVTARTLAFKIRDPRSLLLPQQLLATAVLRWLQV